MQRPDQIDLFVPFIFLHMSWNPNSGDAAFAPKADRERHNTIDDFEPTTIAHYFDLWRDFDGRRLPVEFDRDWLDVIAVHDGKRISLAVTNMGGRQIAVDLSGVAKKVEATGATQTRLNYHQGEVIFEPEHAVDLTSVPVDVNETTVIRLFLGKRLQPSRTLQLHRWYATDTAIASDGKPLSFGVHVDNRDAAESVRLVIGIHRCGGITEPLAVEMNGTLITVDTGDASEFTEFFAPARAPYPLRFCGATIESQLRRKTGRRSRQCNS